MNATRRMICAAVLATCACNQRPSPPRAQDALTELPDTLPAGPGAINAPSSFTRRADSAGARRFHVVNRRFLLTRLYQRDQGESHPLLRETVDETCCLGGERDTRATITLEGRASASQAGTEPAWRVRVKADEGAIWGQFYRAVWFGCCDETDAVTYVNVQTGAVAFVSSREFDTRDSDIPHLRAPNSALERWAAFLDTYTNVDLRDAARDSGIVGILQYGTGREPAPRYVLRWSGGDGFSYRLGKLEFTVDDTAHTHGTEVYLWRANGKESPSALSGFSIAITLLGRGSADQELPDVTMQVPVMGDRVQPERANLPSGWSLRPSPIGN
jgi:hypothetical protein